MFLEKYRRSLAILHRELKALMLQYNSECMEARMRLSTLKDTSRTNKWKLQTHQFS